jgi:hypothetical protein
VHKCLRVVFGTQVPVLELGNPSNVEMQANGMQRGLEVIKPVCGTPFRGESVSVRAMQVFELYLSLAVNLQANE